jgi:hypothetical protein
MAEPERLWRPRPKAETDRVEEQIPVNKFLGTKSGSSHPIVVTVTLARASAAGFESDGGKTGMRYSLKAQSINNQLEEKP